MHQDLLNIQWRKVGSRAKIKTKWDQKRAQPKLKFTTSTDFQSTRAEPSYILRWSRTTKSPLEPLVSNGGADTGSHAIMWDPITQLCVELSLKSDLSAPKGTFDLHTMPFALAYGGMGRAVVNWFICICFWFFYSISNFSFFFL